MLLKTDQSKMQHKSDNYSKCNYVIKYLNQHSSYPPSWQKMMVFRGLLTNPGTYNWAQRKAVTSKLYLIAHIAHNLITVNFLNLLVGASTTSLFCVCSSTPKKNQNSYVLNTSNLIYLQLNYLNYIK